MMTTRPHDTVMETPRLWLRAWRTEDLEAFRYIPTDAQVMRYIRDGRPWTDDEIASFIDREQKRYAKHGYCLWPVIHRESGELIGQCGLKHIAQTDLIEVGWWIATKHWGQGLATEAGRAALTAGFERFGLERIVAIAHPDNAASVRIMQKLGMAFVRKMPRSELGLAGEEPVVLYEAFSTAGDARGC